MRIIINITVAITDATVVRSAARKVISASGRESQRVKTLRGRRKITRKSRQMPERKRPNIQLETVLMRSRMELMSAGRATR